MLRHDFLCDTSYLIQFCNFDDCHLDQSSQLLNGPNFLENNQGIWRKKIKTPLEHFIKLLNTLILKYILGFILIRVGFFKFQFKNPIITFLKLVWSLY